MKDKNKKAEKIEKSKLDFSDEVKRLNRVIGQIEDLSPELKRDSLPHEEVLEQGKIHPELSGSAHGIAPGVAERKRSLRTEGRRIKPAVDQTLAARQVRRRDRVRPVSALRITHVADGRNSKRQAGPVAGNPL